MSRIIHKHSISFLFILVLLATMLLPTKSLAEGGRDTITVAPAPSSVGCTEMFVDISTSCLVPCSNSDYFVRYCNFGDEIAINSYVEIAFDSTFTINGASIPIADQTGNVLTFNLGDVAPNDCGSFSINISLACDVTLGQAHCVDAQIFPDGACTPPSGNWDGSNVEVTIECQGDSIYFNLENIGGNNMGQSSQFIIIEDDVIVMLQGYFLNSGQDTTIVVPNNGGFYHIEAGQTANNPSGFYASASTEGCDNITTGFLTQYPEDDGILSYEQNCMVNDTTCSFNNKTALPIGIDTFHFINPNQPLQYQVNFQNTTTETISTITVCDTLSPFLDPQSLMGGSSSEDYTLTITGNIVKIIFENLNLPPGGTGFVKFQVGQMPGNSPCTRIDNWAGIFFDGQDSVVTDTVFHTIPCITHVVDSTIIFCGGGGYYAGTFYSQNSFVSNTTNFSTFTSQLNTTILVHPGTPDETIEVSICEGESYTYNGQSFNASGTYVVNMTDPNGCPYTVTIILTVIENVEEIITAAICQGDVYDFFGQSLTSSGIYSHVIPSGPCFEIFILLLTANQMNLNTDTLQVAICQGDTLFWEGEILTEDTIIVHQYNNQFGCDSLSKLKLVVHPNFDATIDTAICEGDSFFIGDNGYSLPGSYSDTLLSIHNCDSIVSLHLSILPMSQTGLAAVICEGEEYQVGSEIYTQTGSYLNVLTAENGCDSIVTLELIVQAKDSLCFANAGLDTAICGYSWMLVGSPSVGSWDVLCNVSDGLAAFEVINDSSAVVTVSECGSYNFKYTHMRIDTVAIFDSIMMSYDTIIDTCVVSDIVNIEFEDPSYRQLLVNQDLSLNYNDYTCMEDDGVTCSNIFIFEEVTPEPEWKFDVDATCQSNIFSTSPGNVIEDCLLSDIAVNQILFEDSYNPGAFCTSQDFFLTLDSLGQTVLDNDIKDLIDSLFSVGINNVVGACPAPAGTCFTPIECFRDTLGFDTLSYPVPVHLGGQWTYFDEMGVNHPLQDMTDLFINNLDYRLIISPNAITYSPVQFTMWQLFPNDSLVAPSSPVSITLLWKERWTYDTIQLIRPILSPLPDSCLPVCPLKDILTLDFSGIPSIPEFLCPPFTLTFEGTTLAVEESIICHSDLTYTVQLVIHGGILPYSVTGLAGSFVSDSIFVSEPIPYQFGYLAEVMDSAGCELIIVGDTCRCLRYHAQAIPLVEMNCIDSCILLAGTVLGNGTEWEAEWCDASGLKIASGLTVVICEPGYYYFKVTDIVTGCTDIASVVVEINAPIAEAGPNQLINCFHELVMLHGDELTGGLPMEFSWTGPGINATNQALENPTVVIQGTYTLTVTNPVTGCSDTDVVQVNLDNNTPDADIVQPSILNCIDTIVTLVASNSTPLGQLSFNWSTSNGNIISGLSTPLLVVNAPGTYILTITDNSNGCTDMAEVTVLSDDILPSQVSAGPDMQVDCGDSIIMLQGFFAGQGNFIYTWLTTDGNILSGQNTLMPAVDASGIYILSVVNLDNGCSSSDETIVIADFEYPTAIIAEPDTLNCIQLQLMLDGQGSSVGQDIIYSWTTHSGNLVGGDNGTTPTIDAPGVYYFTVLDSGNNCSTTDSIEIVEDIIHPQVDAGQDTYFNCKTDSLQLNGQSQTANISYQWTALSGNIASGSNSEYPWVDEPGIYVLEVTNSFNGCTSLDTVLIEAYEPVSFDIVTFPDCHNSDVGSVLVVNLQGQGSIYFFELDNGQVQYDSLFPELPAGNYTLSVFDQDTCSVEVDFTIMEVPELPDLQLEESYHFCGTGNPLILDVTVPLDSQWVSYYWSNGAVDPVISTTEEGVIIVEISTGCETQTYEIQVVDDLRNASYFEMPNAFSPNNDGINDVFRPVSPNHVEAYELLIFDRWGEKVFDSKDFNMSWDGTYRGKQVPSDVYIYKVYATYNDCVGMQHKFVLKGDVTLLR